MGEIIIILGMILALVYVLKNAKKMKHYIEAKGWEEVDDWPVINTPDYLDVYFADAARLIVEKEGVSIGMLQRMYKIGFFRAERIMDQLEENGVVDSEEGTKSRKVLMDTKEVKELLKRLATVPVKGDEVEAKAAQIEKNGEFDLGEIYITPPMRRHHRSY